MKRKLFVLSGDKSDLLSALEKEYTLSPGTLTAPLSRTLYFEREHVLFVDATALDESTILSHNSVKAALSSGIPIVVLRPTSSLLRAISGYGVENVAACIIVQGKHRATYCKTYMDATATRLLSGVAWTSEKGETAEEAGAKPEDETDLQPTGHIEDTIVEPDLQTLIPEDIAKADQIEEILAQLERPWQRTTLPPNRITTAYFGMDWATSTLSDPSGETNSRQTSRFQFSVIYQLIAADQPRAKILGITIGGPGFEPFSSTGAMIRDDHKHRGWAQSVTKITINPEDASFGNVQDYVPANAANQVAITAGFSWELGFSGGSDGGSVSASFSRNNSHTISSVDFRTLTATYGTRGMRFFQNTYIVGGDTIVDSRYFGFSNLVSQSGWTSEMSKMFYTHISGQRVRSWPSLSKQLIKPDSECVYYTPSTETRTGRMVVTGGQGRNYFYTKQSILYNYHAWIERSTGFTVNFNSVNYNS